MSRGSQHSHPAGHPDSAPIGVAAGSREAIGCSETDIQTTRRKRVLDVPKRARRALPASLATRYLRAAAAAGAAVTELIVEPDGRIRLLLGAVAPVVATPDADLDAWLNKKGARS